MGDIAREYLQVRVLRTFEPLSSLSADKLEELANKSEVEELPPGRLIFRQGEKDKRCVYLLSGTLELQITGNPNPELVKAKTIESKYPIAQEIPRPSTCRTKTNAVLLYIDSDLLEFVMDDSPSGMYEVTEIRVDQDPESDWMLRFLQSPAFLRLPTEKIQNLLMKFQEVPVSKGQVIIKQGDIDPYYYIVKEGQCIVSRRPAPAAEEVRLAILGPGDGFGEEALITHGKRNATITMKDAGVLMRLGKNEFNELLVKPLIQHLQHPAMIEKVRAGAAIIDVRTNKEFNENGIKGAQSIPISMLRVKTASLNPTRDHILYCNDGNQSTAAAFLLAQHSIPCYVLAGGLAAQSKPFAAAQPPLPEIALDTGPISQPSSQSIPRPALKPATPNPHIQTGEFEMHRFQAKTQAERANEAEKIHKNFSARTQQLRSEADALRNQAHRLAEKTSAAETERKKAETEIRHLQEEANKQREEMFAAAKLAIAKEKERAQQETQRIKLATEQAHKHAEEEFNRARREAKELAERQTRLEAEVKQAEEQKRKAAQAAEEARHMAKLEAERVKQEAELIRQRALDEAKQLRENVEKQRVRMAAEEAAKRTTALDEARRRAELAIQQAAQAAEEARRQAQLEADAIRQQAREEAQKLRHAIEQEAKKSIQKQQADEQLRYQQFLEESRQRAYEEAQQQAEIDAQAIRRQAIEDAEQLRAEIEATRRMIEQENLLVMTARQQGEIERQAHADAYAQAQAAEQAAARTAAEATRRLQEEARRRRKEEDLRAAEENRRVTELARRQAAQEMLARQAREEEAQRLALEEVRRSEANQRTAQQQKALANEKARQRAEVLKERMLAQDIARQQPDEFLMQTGIGMKLSSAKLHVVKDKTILEGEEDIFIFKAPSQRPPSREEAEALIKQAEQQMQEQSRKELPSFDIDYDDDLASPSLKTAEDHAEFSESIITDLSQLTAYTKPQSVAVEDEFNLNLPISEKPAQTQRLRRSRRNLYALAASVVVMVAVSIVAVTRPTYMDANLVANISEPRLSPQQNEPRGLASLRALPPPPAVTSPAAPQNTAAEKATAETRVRNEAEVEFQRLLEKWRSEQQTATAKSSNNTP
ncbi:MAG: cyclic nucleotide-binding domain-containing protein [Gammaproteobacteria bacterium]|nr:cyclic nucleotide-binding domain-containing protein [Gammaproteobacteria bacterium]